MFIPQRKGEKGKKDVSKICFEIRKKELKNICKNKKIK